MERCSNLLLLCMVCVFFSCKKKTEMEDPAILVKSVYIEMIKSDRVDVKYQFSHLGYQETGVLYYKKSDPNKVSTIHAIRQAESLKLSLEHLEPNTEYAFKVFYKLKDVQQIDVKEYTVKTLSLELAKFALEIKNDSIIYDASGNFTADLIGENLNDLNLRELDVKLNGTTVDLDYPVQLASGKYKITIKGKSKPVNAISFVVGSYQGKEIFFQSVPFVSAGEKYWLSYKPTLLRCYYTSVFDNELYYFNQQVLKWNVPDQRLMVLRKIPEASISGSAVGIQFDEQLFFPVTEKTDYGNINDSSDDVSYRQAYSYHPVSGEIYSYPLEDQSLSKSGRMIENNNCFIHKGELYLTFSLVDQLGSNPSIFPKSDSFIYRYNKATKTFEFKGKLDPKILNHHFVSIKDQLYLLGLVPVYDQGLQMSATLSIFEVSEQTFKPEEIYRGGTVAEPLTFRTKSAVVYDQKILIAAALDNFILFDPSNRELYPVLLKNNINNMYFGGFFSYNNKLHLNADLFFTSQKIYEISIVKGN